MTIRQLIIIIFSLPTILFGQTKYKHDYRVQLTAQPSTYLTQVVDTGLKGKCLVNFVLLDNIGDSVWGATIKIKNSKADTLIQLDKISFGSIKLSADTFDISIDNYWYTKLRVDNIFLKANSKIIFKTSLGRTNAVTIAHIHSSRKLTKEEIDKITANLSSGKRDKDFLRNETWYVDWEE